MLGSSGLCTLSALIAGIIYGADDPILFMIMQIVAMLLMVPTFGALQDAGPLAGKFSGKIGMITGCARPASSSPFSHALTSTARRILGLLLSLVAAILNTRILGAYMILSVLGYDGTAAWFFAGESSHSFFPAGTVLTLSGQACGRWSRAFLSTRALRAS